MTFIDYPSSSIDGCQKPSSVQQDQYHPTYKKLIRTAICGALFAVPFGVAVPSSPLLRLSQTQANKRNLIPRMMSDFIYVNFLSSTFAYWFLVEPTVKNPRAKEGFMPYLGPLTAQVPSTACLIGSHLFYPGMWAVFNEISWKARRREFARLNTKCFFAYAPLHVPAAIAIGAAVGLCMFPFKFFKDRAYAREAESGVGTAI